VSREHKQVVRRLVDEVMNGGRLEVLDELYEPRRAAAARRWMEPFLAAFSDVHMRIEDLIAEDDRVVVRLACSGRHSGHWRGHAPTGRRFTDVNEVCIFRVTGGHIIGAWVSRTPGPASISWDWHRPAAARG